MFCIRRNPASIYQQAQFTAFDPKRGDHMKSRLFVECTVIDQYLVLWLVVTLRDDPSVT